MTYLSFDIETIGQPLDEFDEVQQDYLLRGADTDELREKKIGEFALSPLTGRIVCIGLQVIKAMTDGYHIEKSVAYAVDDRMADDAHHTIELPSGAQCHVMNEPTMLKMFWALLRDKFYDAHLVSFNGRNFDAPYLMLRSAVLGIRPSRNLMEGTKFNYRAHTDLLDQLTFFMPSAQGATRRFNFDFYTKAFGITSPKAEGVDGTMVGDLFAKGDVESIAEYCLRDVRATWELYVRWKEQLG
jgi:DNA polymerase elongation subunit (family B)